MDTAVRKRNKKGRYNCISICIFLQRPTFGTTSWRISRTLDAVDSLRISSGLFVVGGIGPYFGLGLASGAAAPSSGFHSVANASSSPLYCWGV